MNPFAIIKNKLNSDKTKIFRNKFRKPNLSPIRISKASSYFITDNEMKADFERDHDSSDLIELEGINDLYRLLNIEMDTQIDCFIYKGLKYKLNLRQDAISQNLYKFLASSIPKNIAKRISDEEKTQDLNRTCKLGSSTQSVPICKERPNTATGRMFGTVSGEINPENQIKTSKIETPNGCICREEIKRIEKEFSAKQEEIYKLKKMIK